MDVLAVDGSELVDLRTEKPSQVRQGLEERGNLPPHAVGPDRRIVGEDAHHASVSGMKSRVQRGRRRLRERLTACCQIQVDRGGSVADYRPKSGACGCRGEAGDSGAPGPGGELSSARRQHGPEIR